MTDHMGDTKLGKKVGREGLCSWFYKRKARITGQVLIQGSRNVQQRV